MEKSGETLYLRNIDEKIKIPKLKESLKELFGQYGTIIDIVAHKNIRLRGQAFVVFDELESAIKAHNSLTNQDFLGRPLIVQFAKTKSDATVLKNTPDQFEQHKQNRKPLTEAKNALIRQAREQASKKRKASPATGESAPKRQAKKTASAEEEHAIELPPHKILFLEKLPDGIQQDTLVEIFKKYDGFIEVRLFTVRHLGFVEYETDDQAIVAKADTEGLELGGSKIKITYAKK